MTAEQIRGDKAASSDYMALSPTRSEDALMAQNSNPLFDTMAKVMTDAAGVASSARREIDALVKSQIERLLRDADVVTREEFEAVREMAVLAREENEKLSTRILELEAKLGTTEAAKPAASKAAAKATPKT